MHAFSGYNSPMITLYLDMDGVLADFNKEYTKYDPFKEDRKKFRSAVMEHKIFEKPFEKISS